MPSTSKKQHNFMAAIANNPSFAKKVGIPQSVGEDFSAADKGKKFGRGGMAALNKQNTQHGSMDMPFKSSKKFGGMKFGGKVRRFQEGGFSEAQEKWLGDADRTDPHILRRMRNAVPDKPNYAPVEDRRPPALAPTPAAQRNYSDLDPAPAQGADSNKNVAAVKPPREDTAVTVAAVKPPREDKARKAAAAELSRESNRPNTSRQAPASPTAKTKIDASDDDFARKIKKDKADDEAGAADVVSKALMLAGMVPFAGPAVRGISTGVKAINAARAARAARTAEAREKAKEAAYDARRASDMEAGFKKGGTMKYAKGGMAGGGMSPTAMAAMMARRRPRMGAGMPPVMPPAPMGMKKGGMANFEKSGKDAEKKGMKEGSKADMAMDKKQMMGMNMGGMTRKFGKGGMHKMPDGKMMKNSAMNMGGMAGMKKGGMPMKDGKPAFMMGKKMNMGGMAKGTNMNPKGSTSGSSRAGENTKIQKRGLTEGRVIKMASGGSVSSASRRADGIAQRGKTRC